MSFPDNRLLSGKLVDWITLLRPVESRTPTGQPIKSYDGAESFVDSCWAEVREISGREAMVAGAVQVVASHIVRIRTEIANVQTDWKIEWAHPKGLRTLYVVHVGDPSRTNDIHIYCNSVPSKDLQARQ